MDRIRRALAVLLAAVLVVSMCPMDTYASASNTETSNQTQADEADYDRELPLLSDLYSIEGQASAWEYDTDDTDKVSEALGYDTALQSMPKASLFSRFISLFSSDDISFNDIYINYDSSYGTTLSDTVQDLKGDATNQAQLVKVQLEFKSDIEHPKGSVEIHIPLNLYQYRDGSTYATMDQIGVPKAPGTSKSSAFNYTIVGDTIVIKNAKAILGKSSNMIQVFYALDDIKTTDGQTWEFAPEVLIDGVKQDVGQTLTGSMDTETNLTQTNKVGFTIAGSNILPELYTEKQVNGYLKKAGTQLADGWNFDGYKYMIWRTSIAGKNSQPWTLTATDTPGQGGIVLGQYITNRDDYVLSKSASDTITWADQSSYDMGNATYIYSIVAYPETDWPADNTFNNSISVTLKGTDEPEGHTLESSTKWVWEEYNWIYEGYGLDRKKDLTTKYPNSGAAWIDVYKNNVEKNKDTELADTWRAYGKMNGYSLTGNLNADGKTYDGSKSYTLVTTDDAQYIKSDQSTYSIMDEKDYYYTSMSISVNDYSIDIYENEVSRCEDGDDVKISVMTADNHDVWTALPAIPYADLDNGIYTMPQTWLGKKIYRVKVEHSCNDYYTECTITGKTALRAGSEKIQGLIADQNATTMTIENLVGAYCTYNNGADIIQEDPGSTQYDSYPDLKELSNSLYGGILPTRDNTTQTVKRGNGISNSVKSAKGSNNVDASRVDLTYTLSGYDGYEVYSTDAANVMEADGYSVARYSSKFYDLLPIGITYDPSVAPKVGRLTSITNAKASGSWDASDVSVTTKITDDYKNSGRQMVEFTLTYNGVDPTKIEIGDFGQFYNWYTGFGVEFHAYYPWSLDSICDGATNVSAYMVDDMKGNASADDGSGDPTNSGNLLSDLDGDGNTTERCVSFSTAQASVIAATAAEGKKYKQVRSDDSQFSEYVQDTQTSAGSTYTYKVGLSTVSAKNKDIVIYDILENADNASLATDDPKKDHMDSASWHGTLIDVNTAALTSLGVNPVVYYSTNPAAKYDLTDAASAWTTTKPTDLSTVKAIAVDSSKKVGGDEFVLDTSENIYIEIHMQAPDTIPEGVTYAYNNAAFSYTQVGNTDVAIEAAKTYATSVSLVEKTKLTVEKTAVTGVGANQEDTFDFLVYIYDNKLLAGDESKYIDYPYANQLYTLYEKDSDGVYQEVPGMHATDGTGRLTLTLGQRAEFDSVGSGLAYKVIEDNSVFYIPSVGGAETDTASGSIDGETSVEFTNQYKTPLYFEKATQYLPGDITIDDDFTFVLKLNDAVAANIPYYLVDSSVAMNRDQIVLNDTPLTTDADGKFTIKAGQRVLFRTDSGDKYTITEADNSYGEGTNWNCDTPEVSGTTKAPYSSASISNQYKFKSIVVSETLTAKKGYTLTEDDKNHPFNFIIYVDGKPWEGDYSTNIYGNTDWDPDTVLHTSDGTFSITSGATVILRGIPAGSKYEVKQIDDDGYPIVTPDTGIYEGTLGISTAGPILEYVNTKNDRDLRVSKAVMYNANDESISSDANNTEFPFTLTIGGQPANGITYYKNTSGTSYESYTSTGTITNGEFTLKNGEFIWFTGLKIGDEYKIVEKPSLDGKYKCLSPEDGEIDGIISSDKNAATAEFRNQYGEITSLVVNKQWDADISQVSDPNAQYYITEDTLPNYLASIRSRFYIKFYNSDGTDYDGPDFSYRIQDQAVSVEIQNGVTDSSVTLFIRGNGSITFFGMPEGTRYEIIEQNICPEGEDYYDYNSGPLKIMEIDTQIFGVSPEGLAASGQLENDTTTEYFKNKAYFYLARRSLFFTKYLDDVALYGKADIAPLAGTDRETVNKILGKPLTLQLQRYDPVTGAYVPVPNVRYNDTRYDDNLSNGVFTMEDDKYTDSEGKFTLIPRWVHNSKYNVDLLAGVSAFMYDAVQTLYDYRIIEIDDESDDAWGTPVLQYFVYNGINSVSSYDIYDKNLSEANGEGFQITKRVTGETDLNDPEFKFKLEVVSGGYSELTYVVVPAKKLPYKIDGTTYYTKDDGTFTLKANQTAKFLYNDISFTYEGGMPGFTAPTFRVTELTSDMPAGYQTVGPNMVQNDASILNTVFTNNYNPSPNLTIKKTVTNESGFTAPSSDEFTFSLKVNGSLYKNEEYQKYKADGTQVTDSDGNIPTWKTDSSGSFTMKASEYVVFPWVGAGKSYEITEESKADYTQTQPAAGTSATGTVEALGSSEEFINHYGKPRSSLVVRDTLIYPSGYEVPDVTMTYSISTGADKDNLSDFASMDYVIYNADSTPAGSGTTDLEGNFKLKPGQYAVFKNIESDSIYEVTQLEDENGEYSLIDSSGTTGMMTPAGATAIFTNGMANFLVKKSVVSANASLVAPVDDEFTFTASSAGKAIANASIVIYDNAGHIIDNKTTDASGKFTLKDKQGAMFMGLPSGTVITVTEDAKTNYTQTLPTSTAGYTRTLGTNVEILPFENTYEIFTGVRVEKKVEAAVGTVPPSDSVFTFEISKDGLPAANEIYTIGSTSYRTDAEGQFKLKAGESALFKKMLAGTDVEVHEITENMPRYYSPKDDAVSGSATLTQGTESLITLINTYWSTVEYTWTGTVPDGVILPVPDADGDGIRDRYDEGTDLTVDTTYPAGYTIEGTYNGKDGKFVFSGFTPTSSTVVDGNGHFSTTLTEDAEFTGTWTFVEDMSSTYTKGYETTAHLSADIPSDTVVGDGDQITYTVDVTNSGSTIAPYTTVRMPIPDGTTYVDGTATHGGVYVPATATDPAYIEWVVTDLDPDSTEQLTFTTSVDDGTTGRIIATAKYDTTDTDPGAPGTITGNPTKITNTIIHTTEGSDAVPALVEVIKTASPSSADEPVKEGEEITYELEVINHGGSDATDVYVRDVIPGGTTFVSADNGGNLNAAGYAEWTIGSLAAGDSQILTMVVSVDASPNGRTIRNQASYEDNWDGSKSEPGNTSNIVENISEVTEQTTVITVTKKWAGYENANQPTDVHVALKKGTETIGTAVLNAANNWTYSWDNMPVYATSSSAALGSSIDDEAIAETTTEAETEEASPSDATVASSSDADIRDEDGVLLDGEVEEESVWDKIMSVLTGTVDSMGEEVTLDEIEYTVVETDDFSNYDVTVERNGYAYTITNTYTYKKPTPSSPHSSSGNGGGTVSSIKPPTTVPQLNPVGNGGSTAYDPTYGLNPDGTPRGNLGMQGLPKTGEERKTILELLAMLILACMATLVIKGCKSSNNE